MMKRLVLIDGHAILHRAYHALPSLTTSKGELVNAVFGFTSMILKIFEELHPEYVVCAFDVKAPTFRHKAYKEYKANRPKMDDELATQIPLVKRMVEAFNIPIFEKEGYEADDVIGTLAKQAACLSQVDEVVIATGDRDVLQLIDKKIKVYCPLKGLSDPVIYDEKLVKEKYGLASGQLIDYKTLIGDPSDNIPGMPGIGPKTATKLLQQFGSIKEIYKKIKTIDNEKVKERLISGKKELASSKKLVTIVTDVPIDLDLKKCQLVDYDREKVISLFFDLEFASLVKRLPGNGIQHRTDNIKQTIEDKKQEEKQQQISLF